MTRAEKWEKRNWFLFLTGYFLAGYLLINAFSAGRGVYYSVGFPFEARIPFIPVFILGYICAYGSVIYLYFVIRDITPWRRTAVSFLTLFTLCFSVFLLFPVKMTLRPDIAVLMGNGVIDDIARFYFTVDKPYNAFPSLHVATPTLATLLVWRHYPLAHWILLAMALITAVSVVLVKQHYISDVIAGFIVAVVCFAVVGATQPWWGPFFKPAKDGK